mmetsp:Transcript_11476/g.20628  ORF Transcript_11476/g.20628 Transcript_11476/m.20628 type:complete len:177 (-) Transcript_11476:279-809(-)
MTVGSTPTSKVTPTPSSSTETTDFLSASTRAPRTKTCQNSNSETTDFLSASARTPRVRRVQNSNSETTDFLSASARTPRTRRVQNSNSERTSFYDSLSSSESVPRTQNTRSSSGSASVSGYVPRGHGGGGGAVSQPAQIEQDPLNAIEKTPRGKMKGFGSRMSKLMSRKSKGGGNK